jgi:hypothetical protein
VCVCLIYTTYIYIYIIYISIYNIYIYYKVSLEGAGSKPAINVIDDVDSPRGKASKASKEMASKEMASAGLDTKRGKDVERRGPAGVLGKRPFEEMASAGGQAGGAHFTCFTGTKVQILTHFEEMASAGGQAGGAHFTCFTGTKVQILTLMRLAGATTRAAPVEALLVYRSISRV